MESGAPEPVRQREPHNANERREQSKPGREHKRTIRLVKKKRRRKIVHERKRQHERKNKANGGCVDADGITRKILLERHHEPAQRIDPDHPKARRHDRELDPEFNERSADGDERHEQHETEIDVNAGIGGRSAKCDDGNDEFVGPYLCGNRYCGEERVDRTDEEPVEAAFADHRRHLIDAAEKCEVRLRAEHP